MNCPAPPGHRERAQSRPAHQRRGKAKRVLPAPALLPERIVEKHLPSCKKHALSVSRRHSLQKLTGAATLPGLPPSLERTSFYFSLRNACAFHLPSPPGTERCETELKGLVPTCRSIIPLHTLSGLRTSPSRRISGTPPQPTWTGTGFSFQSATKHASSLRSHLPAVVRATKLQGQRRVPTSRSISPSCPFCFSGGTGPLPPDVFPEPRSRGFRNGARQRKTRPG